MQLDSVCRAIYNYCCLKSVNDADLEPSGNPPSCWNSTWTSHNRTLREKHTRNLNFKSVHKIRLSLCHSCWLWFFHGDSLWIPSWHLRELILLFKFSAGRVHQLVDEVSQRILITSVCMIIHKGNVSPVISNLDDHNLSFFLTSHDFFSRQSSHTGGAAALEPKQFSLFM